MGSRVTGSTLYRVLIVEDEPEQQTKFKECLKQEAKSKGIEVEIETAASLLDAQQWLNKRHFHFVSIDQRLPRSKDEQILDDNGMAFCDYLVNKSPLTQRVLYTAYGDISHANETGITNGTHYWQKSTRTDREKKQFEADGWAKEILRILTEKHIDFCMQQAAKMLPLLFARLAAGISFDKLASDPTPTVKTLKRLAEDVIQLSWLVSIATMQQKQPIVVPVKPALSEKYVADLLDQSQTGELGKYLGHNSQSFQTHLLPFVHDLRTMDDQALAKVDMAEFQQKYKNGLLILTDMLAWLANHSLVVRKSETGLWKKLNPIQGATVIKHEEIGTNEQAGEAGNLYWVASVADKEKPGLHKLDPLVRYLYNPQKDESDLALFSHREGSSWIYRTLAQDEFTPASIMDPYLPQQLERIFSTDQ